MTPPRSLLAAGLLAAMAGWSGPDARATIGPPEVFDVAADGAAVLNQSAFPAAVPLALATGLARSSVTINSQPRAQSQAAIGYSPLAESAPALGVPVPGEAQPWCYSYLPGDPAEASCGGPAQEIGFFRASFGSGHTKTTGDPAEPRTLRSQASTMATQVAATGLPHPVLIGAAVSAASAGAEGARMAGAASTAVEDLTVTGVLHVASIRSRVAGALGGTPGSGAVEREFLISGAEVGGVPVTIDGEGVHAGGQSSSPVMLQGQVNQVLANAGVAVRTVPAAPPEVASDGTSLRVSSGGLLLTFSRSEAAFSLLVGQSNLQMAASRPEPPGLSADLDTPVATPEVTVGTSPSPAAAVLHRPRPGPAEGLALVSVDLPPDRGAGELSATERPAPRQPSARPAAWRIPYAPFAVLVLAVPLLAQARRLALVPGGPQ